MSEVIVMEFFKDFINEYGVKIMLMIITAVGSYVGMQIKILYAKYVTSLEKRKIVTDVVRAVEQMYHDLNGEEKLQRAIAGATEILGSRGIKVTDFELRMLIEAAVSGFNYGFGTELLLGEPVNGENAIIEDGLPDRSGWDEA